MKNFNLKSIIVGVIIGIISTILIFLLMGDIDIEIELGEKENSNYKNKKTEYIPFNED